MPRLCADGPLERRGYHLAGFDGQDAVFVREPTLADAPLADETQQCLLARVGYGEPRCPRDGAAVDRGD